MQRGKTGSWRERLGVLAGWAREAERTRVRGRGRLAPTSRPHWAARGRGGRERKREGADRRGPPVRGRADAWARARGWAEMGLLG
jgi:hypothetical protein